MCTSHSSLQMYFLRKMIQSIFLVVTLILNLQFVEAKTLINTFTPTFGTPNITATIQVKNSAAGTSAIPPYTLYYILQTPFSSTCPPTGSETSIITPTISTSVVASGNLIESGTAEPWDIAAGTVLFSNVSANLSYRVCIVAADSTGANYSAILFPTLNTSGTGSKNLSLSKVGAGSITDTVTTGTGYFSSVNCGSICSRYYDANSTVTLTITPDSGNQLNSLSGGCITSTTLPSTTAVTATVAMGTGNKTCTATFGTATVTPHQLAVTVSGSGTVTSSPTGINSCTSSGGAACSANFNDNTAVTLTATPASGFAVNWTGDCSSAGTATTASVTMDAAKTCTATFNPLATGPYTLSITKSGTGNGTVTSTSPDTVINCGSTCSSDYASNATVDLTAAPSGTDTFGGWGGACSSAGTATTASVTMDAAKTCTATFSPASSSYTLTITKSGTGNGTVTSTSPDTVINCGSTCFSNYTSGATVDLTAAPSGTDTFGGWGGACSGMGTTTSVTMDAAKNCTATFSGGTTNYTLTTSASGSGTVGLSPSGGSYASGTSVSLTASANSGATFASWSGDCSGTSTSTTVTMTSNKSCTATFNTTVVTPPPPPPATFGLGLKKDGTGSGKVFSDTGMECGSYCTDEFESSKTVTLSATPDLGSTFVKFTCSSGETSTQPSLSVRMNAVKICTATFNQVPKYKLSVSTQGKATGTVTTQPTATASCGTGCFEFYEGTQVTLIPQPAAGAAFTEWSSNCPDGKITIKSAGNSCTATFMPLYTLTVATAGTGLGTVSSTPTGIECGNGKTSCAKIYGEGVSVTLTPTASAGFAFAGWNPECTDGKVTLNSHKTCTATFMPIFTLKVAVAGAPSGQITSDPAGIDCGTTCSTTVAASTKIALIPTSSQLGVTFTGWSGDCVSSNVITMDTDKQCTANFANTGTTQFSSKTFEIKEDGKQAVITVKRVSGATGALTSHYTTADGTAKADGDYTPSTGTLEWKDGETADKTFVVPVNFDNDIEGNETLKVRLLNSSGGVRDEAVLTIVDVIVPNALQFSHPLARINEADGKVRLTVVRAANSAGKVTVDYATQDKDAVAGLDYVAQHGTLTWENGDMERKFIEIPIISNPNKNVNTQFQIVLSNPQPATIAVLGPNKFVTVSIVNTATATVAGGSVEFSSDHYDVNESKGNIEILLKRSGSKVGSVSVLFATQDGSAVQDVDYIGKQQRIEWADNDDSDKSIILTIPYNAQPEADKVVNLTLSDLSAGANLGAIEKATLRIIDSYATPTTSEPEKPQRGIIQFGSNSYQAEEGSLVALKVSRVGGNKDMLTVKYMTSNGTAKTGEDYVGRLGELTWLDGESGDKFISLSLLDNTVRDNDRNFTVQLFPVNNSVVSNDTATVLLKDNDNTTVQFTAATFTALENAGEATVTVSRQQGSLGNVTVYYQLQEETAKAGTDFALASGRLLWLDGDTTDKSFGIKLYDNSTFNGNRTLKVSLHTPDGASLGVPNTATLTIQEDDSSVQPECQPKANSLECGFDNAGKTLENIKISATGTVQGGTLSGKIENLGTVRDVVLQPGTQLIGGNLRGTISGVKATIPVRLIAVKIATATLQHVIIDAQSVLADDVVLGEGVLFESNATIPAVSLMQTLGTITLPFNTATSFAAVKLSQDVLFNSISGGIVTAINELAELKNWGLKLQQNPNTGYLETTAGNIYYAVLPVEVRHVLKYLLNGQMKSGVFRATDGSITFITYTGRWVRTVPVLHDSQAFLVGLNGFGLTQFSVFSSGNFRVPVANTGIYYSARPNIFATRIQTRESVNLDVLQMPIKVNYGEGWQQSLYPTAAQPEAIYALSPEAVLEQDGRVILKLGSGETQRTFYGIFDYVVTPGTATQGDSLFYQIEDKDGDGAADYRIVYPNGDGQLIFAR